MGSVFSTEDRQNTFEWIVSAARECAKIVALVHVGSGAYGYLDERSDLDFVIALDSAASMTEVMNYMHQRISEIFQPVFFTQNESRRLQVYLLQNMLEIDMGYGSYEHAAALKPAFRVLYDRSGTVEEKMIRSREWMDAGIFGEKQKKDQEQACSSVWMYLMHAAVAIYRKQYFRAIGEMDCARMHCMDLLGDRYRLESRRNREMDRLPEEEKTALRSTFPAGETPAELWEALDHLTSLAYRELEGCSVPVTEDMLFGYYRGLRPETDPC